VEVLWKDCQAILTPSLRGIQDRLKPGIANKTSENLTGGGDAERLWVETPRRRRTQQPIPECSRSANESLRRESQAVCKTLRIACVIECCDYFCERTEHNGPAQIECVLDLAVQRERGKRTPSPQCELAQRELAFV